MTRRAIILGVETYKKYNPTPFCHADADLLAKTLVEYCDYTDNNVEVLKFSKEYSITPDKLLEKLKCIHSQSQPGDTLLFYFAGHGTYKNNQSYLILPESDENELSTILSLKEVCNLVRVEKGVNFRIFDACHSGQDIYNNVRAAPRTSEFSRDIIESSPSEGWVTFTACRFDEYSHSDNALGHGVFTYYLAESIRSVENNQRVLPELIKIYVCDKVREWSVRKDNKQTPTFSTALSGNADFAQRVNNFQPSTTMIQTGQNSLPLAQRLNALRKVPILGGDEHITKIQGYVKKLSDSLTDEIKKLDWLGAQIREPSVNSPESAPDYVKEKLIELGKQGGLQPLHTLRRDPEYAYIHPVAKIFVDPHIIKINYTINQHDFPNSYVSVQIDSDSYVPSALLYGYLLPLKTTVCLILGGAVLSPQKEESRGLTVDAKRSIFGIDSDGDEIKQAVIALVDRIHTVFKHEAEQHANYLEWESSQISI